MLWRALKHVQNGFYIDVGAAWPDEHSVTKAFYDRGWRGINIEPNPIHFLSLKKQRERDINLQIAVGENAGELTMNFIGNTGLSTLDETIAIQHKVNGWGVESATVSVQPLSRIVSLNVPNGHEVHFLKVDIEGFEKQALQSHDWVKYRPWIVLVEATLPLSQKESFADWEPILLGADYLFVYADGLNRFYVDREHRDLIAAFKYPPNVFDGFVLTEKVQAEAKAQQAQDQAMNAEAKAQQAQDQAMNAEAKAQQANEQAVQSETQLQSVYNSNSWRITAPLRWPMHQWRLLRVHGLKQRVKTATKKVCRYAVSWVLTRPKLKALALKLTHKLGAADRLKPLVRNLIASHSRPFHQRLPQPTQADQQALTPRARQIYQDLKQSIEKNKVGGV